MEVKIEASWKALLKDTFDQTYFQELAKFVRTSYQQGVVYPPGEFIFRAFDHCPLDQVKVVILGQDPYHGPAQANGLCFSVNEGIPLPPSLLNIFKERKLDLGLDIPPHGSLIHWAEQGVLLLNATLTVDAHEPGSHQNKGWETFTDVVIQRLSREREHLVFILWGSYAQKKGAVIDSKKHFIVSSPHPSPLSAYRGFFGSKPFSKTNEYLTQLGKSPINW